MAVKDNAGLRVTFYNHINPVEKVEVFRIAHSDVFSFAAAMCALFKIEDIIAAFYIWESVSQDIDWGISVSMDKHNPVVG